MPSQHEGVFAALAAPFDPSEVKERSQAGRKFSYITARIAANRLDEVLGPENWRQEYRETKGGLICRLWFRLTTDGEWSWKEDGGGFAGMTEGDNNEKSSFSDAFKRAAAMLGVARYLYRDGIPNFGEIPVVPASTLPSPPRGRRPEPRRPESSQGRQSAEDGPPTTGRQLFRWIKEREAQYGPGLLEMVNDWGRGNQLKGRLVDWPSTAAVMAYEYALTTLPRDGVSPEESERYEEALSKS